MPTRNTQLLAPSNLENAKPQARDLRARGEYLHLALEAANIRLWDFDPQADTTLFSPQWFTMLGYEPDELPHTHESWEQLLHPDDRSQTVQRLREFLAGTEELYHAEFRMQAKSGEWRWIDARGRVVLRDAEGNIARMVGVHTDVTKLKQMEIQRDEMLEALREERDRAQQYLDVAGVMLVALNDRGEITMMNRKGLEILEYQDGELVGQNWFDTCLPTRIVEDVKTVYEGLMAGEIEPVKEFENSILTKSGEERTIAWHNTVLRDESGQIVGTLSSGEDITERKRAEEALHLNADRLKALHAQVQRHAEELEQRVTGRTQELSAMYEVMAIASQSLDLETTLAQSLERVLEAMKSSAGLIHLLDQEQNALHLAVQRGIPPDLVVEIKSLPAKGGLASQVIEHGQPLVVPDITADPRITLTAPVSPQTFVGVPIQAGGQILGVLSVLREVTQPQFGAEEVALLTSIADQVGAVVDSARLHQLAEQAAVLEERQRLARDLHDSVTQSLYSLTLLTETSRRAAQVGDLQSVQSYLGRLGEVAQQALKEMRLLIYQLRPPVLEREGLVGALQQRLDAVEGRAGVETRLLVGEDVRLTAPVEDALYHIALEALNNALKHAAATSVMVWIYTADERAGLEITDNGRGFDPAAIRGRGGMGLINMQERVEQLGGTLTILSAPGKGTRVLASVKQEVVQ